MALSSVTYGLLISATETVTLAYEMAGNPVLSVPHSTPMTTTAVLTSGSTPPVTKIWSDEAALTAGAATIDLTALPTPHDDNVTFSTLKVQLVYFKNKSTNTDTLTIVDGATNGYNIFGDASGQVTLGIGDEILMKCNDTLQDVGASDLAIDLSSSDTDATYQVILAAG